MDTQFHAVPALASRRSLENDLDRLLDAATEATAIFRAAVEAYLTAGSESACWSLAQRISTQMCTVDELQQRFATGTRDATFASGTRPGMIEPLNAVTGLLREMRRQITAFAVESGFSGDAREVPAYLVTDLQELSDAVCAAVDELIEGCRPCMLLWGQPMCVGDDLGVSWYESQADRLSMQLIKQIFADEALDLKVRLHLAQVVEEVDRVADYAERVDRDLRAGRMAGLATRASRDSH
ncbi:MAG TPA: hypothetical protein PL117_02875 [Accumulibacter sp.]|uniref:hypothetical protein n=1 Tax=Accumulibacter sp. TaxID=2053492 RepID=UPI002C9E4F3A|nr:hypothetical protein [Accumulibacter sp.]HRF71689.1 hypothetical protein [Accumulibacter sp.]